MVYDIYPCDLDPFGECPKRCQDCAHCVGWFDREADENEEEYRLPHPPGQKLQKKDIDK